MYPDSERKSISFVSLVCLEYWNQIQPLQVQITAKMHPIPLSPQSSQADGGTSRRCRAYCAGRRSTTCLPMLKCDRTKPCLNCTKRGYPESCDYIKQDSSSNRPATLQRAGNIHERIQQLEDMVKSLIEKQTRAHPGATPETSPLDPNSAGTRQNGGFTQSVAASPRNELDRNVSKPSLGSFTRAKDQENFVGSEHWEAVLEDITNLRIDLETPDETEVPDFKPRILFGMNCASRSEIMSSIPARQICDILISRWFSTMSLAPVVVHGPTFMQKYDQMFKEPDETSLMWIGLLFSILGLACHSYAVSGEELHTIPQPFTSMWEMSSLFRDRTTQCLAEVNYLRPKRYTVETLCFYYALEMFQGGDSAFGAYVVLGVIVKVAMRLGYHRDASHYPSISAFDGEMRRRVWSVIFQLDLLTSAQVRLPRMIRDEETDTAEPKNLLDTDFNKNMTELPHPRPITDATPVAYIIFKVRLLRELGLIMDKLNSITPSSYEDVMRLDHKLMETHASLPNYLKMRSLSLSIADDTSLILRRIALEVCFQKSRCVLHRKYLIPGKSNPQFQYSSIASVDAAMNLLNAQCTFNQASQPGGRLAGEEWREAALINQDYILAGMILCLDLAWCRRTGEDMRLNPNDGIEKMWPRNRRLSTLKSSYDIWCKSSTISSVAAKAAEALRVMLKDLESADLVEPSPTSATSVLRSESGMCLRFANPPYIVLTLSPDVSLTPNLTAYDDAKYVSIPKALDFSSQNFDAGSSTTDLFIGTLDTEMNFDWELWDSQFKASPMTENDFDSSAFQ
ncbi:Fusarisetin A cluster transcription factor fsa6 [Lachnellula suecica]|uniref:Fusarisetin A cluster transcription factor fsa6 n=1 Tax=Lachnellula suecica TaxID=602035 RepID=A0A8T9C5G0_9HELO|nr:Fusarisetin A cluster transcription factor fsa6 [Lachnellula suecica]